MSPRERLAAAQAELLRALLAGADPPAGFDPERLAVEADALRAKRRRIVAHLRPDVPAALGDRFGSLFDAYAAANPRTDGTRARSDADEFTKWLAAQGELKRRWRSPLRRIAAR